MQVKSERYFTPAQVSKGRYGGLISVRWLEDARAKGTGPRFIKLSKKVLYAESDLEDWERANKFGSTAELSRAA